MRRPPFPLVLAAAVSLLTAACGSVSGGGGDADSGEAFTLAAYQGEEALGGQEVEFDSLLGREMPVVVNFFAAQCPPCLLEMPWFEQAAQQHTDDVLMVGVDIGPFVGLGTHEQGAQLLRDLGITYPAGAAVDDAPVRRFGVVSMPTTVFFDNAGRLAGQHGGILTQDQIEDWFTELAAQ